MLRQRVTADDGQIVTEGTDRVSGQRVALADVKAVNPPWGRWWPIPPLVRTLLPG